MGKATKFRYLALLLVLAFLGYNSIYFEKLDQRKTSNSPDFDAAAYARKYLSKDLPAALAGAIGADELLQLLDADKEKAFERYSHALGIGNIRFFLVKGQGRILEVKEDEVLILTTPDSAALAPKQGLELRLATEYVFGNAVRDASGLIAVDEFDNTQELNEVAAAVNAIIREEVIPPFKTAAAPGKRVRFTGAIELNRKYPDPDKPEVIPITLNYIE